MRKPRPPPLYRLSRALNRATALVVIALVIFLVICAYSIFQLKPSNVQGVNQFSASLGDHSASLGGSIMISNPGLAPVNSIAIFTAADLENGVSIGNISLPSLSLAPAANTRIPYALVVSFAPGSPAESLLFEDHHLAMAVDVNVTYAWVFTAKVAIAGTFSWGAPFYGINVTAGTPTANPNGTATVPLTLSFSNHARFGLNGSISADVLSAGGTGCGSVVFPVLVPAGTSYSQSEDVTGQPGCLTTGSTIQFTYALGPRLSITLPPEPFP